MKDAYLHELPDFLLFNHAGRTNSSFSSFFMAEEPHPGSSSEDQEPPAKRPKHLPTVFDVFSGVGRPTHGVSAVTAAQLWDKYFISTSCPKEIKSKHLSIFLRYLKTGLETAQLDLLEPGRSAHTVQQKLHNVLSFLHPRIAEVYWADRLAPSNAHPGVPAEVRTTVDSFPVFARYHACPKHLFSLLNNGKYKAPIWKVTCVFTVTGAVAACRIDYGNTPDGRAAECLFQSIAEEGTTKEGTEGGETEGQRGPFHTGEYCLADGAYGTANPIPHLLTPFNVQQLRKSDSAKMFNTWHAFYRARAEHGVRRLKSMAVLRHAQVTPPRLMQLLSVTIHVANMEYRNFVPSAIFLNPPPDAWDSENEGKVPVPIPHANWEPDLDGWLPSF